MHHRRPVALLAVIVLIATASWFPACAAPREMPLVVDGQPRATIVIAAEAAAAPGEQPSTNAAVAAAEFTHYIERMTGAALPIVTDEQAPEAGPLVLIGRSRLTDAIDGLDIPTGRTKTLRDEGFVILCDGERLVLAGNDTEPYLGTRYAVCRMLHHFGVRWFMPGAFGEVVPEARTLTVAAMSVTERPTFAARSYWSHSKNDMAAQRREWQIHNLLDDGRMVRWYGVPGDSSVRGVLPHDQMEADREWGALMANGERNPHMPCMTDPGMINAVAQNLIRRAEAGDRGGAFAPDDGIPRCLCDDCKAMSSGFEGYGSSIRDFESWASTTHEWFYFTTEVLKIVNERFPDYVLFTNGYANRDIPPELPDINPHGNLGVMFANIPACTIHGYDAEHCWQVQRQGQMIRRWCELSDMVWRYNYNYVMLVSSGTLTPMVHRERVDIPLLAEWGMWGFFDQDEPDWSLTGIPTHYVRAALQWNADADVDAILEDFFTKWYGPAAEPMAAYYDTLERAFADSEEHAHENIILPVIYTPELIDTLGGHIEQAESLVTDDAHRQRVQVDRLMYDYLRSYVAFERAKQECDYAKAIATADEMIALKARMHEFSDFFGWRAHPVYDIPWEKRQLQPLLAKTAGEDGALLAVLPEEARFRVDPHDDGLYARWQDADHDDADWGTILTTRGWQSQGYRDERGHEYRGYGWYRLEVDVPADHADRPVHLYMPAVISEAWVWVNGQYVGRREYQQPWFRPQAFEVSITDAVRRGGRNTIAIRVYCDTEVFGANGIYQRMFLYAPTTE